MNNQNKANTAVKFSNSHLLRIESQIYGNVKVKKKLTSIFKQRNTKTFSRFQKVLLNFMTRHQVLKMFVRMWNYHL